ncbi:hypothetical protein GR268_42895, partial [Rhizobium leguminosarum]|nr:hypothetical protein [Rhizobium leguminosarum]
FISGLLLTSCNPDLTPANEDIVEPLAGKRKRIEAKIKTKETDYKRSRTDTDGDHSVSMAEEAATNQTNELTEVNRVTLHDIELPDEVMLQIFNKLSVKDILQASQVCRYWHVLSEDPALWRTLRLSIHGDYPASEATKEQAIKHILRAHVNTLSNPNTIIQLVHKYRLYEQHPFRAYQDLLIRELEIYNTTMIDDYAAQGNQEAINQKVHGLIYGKHGYKKNLKAAVTLNDFLVLQGNEDAISRKIEGLIYSKDGYKKNLKAAV